MFYFILKKYRLFLKICNNLGISIWDRNDGKEDKWEVMENRKKDIDILVVDKIDFKLRLVRGDKESGFIFFMRIIY